MYNSDSSFLYCKVLRAAMYKRYVIPLLLLLSTLNRCVVYRLSSERLFTDKNLIHTTENII